MRTDTDPEKEKYRQYSRYARGQEYRSMGSLRPRHTLRNVLIILIAAAAVFCGYFFRSQIREGAVSLSRRFSAFRSGGGDSLSSGGSEGGTEEDGSGLRYSAQTETETEVQTEDLSLSNLSFSPHAVPSTQPSNLIASTGIEVNGEELADPSSYVSDADISFDGPEVYTDADGIVTFRGNNFRDDPTYGHADIKDCTIEGLWTASTGGLTYGDGTWTGSGWTGQPLMRRWTRQQKAAMAMYDWAKEKDDLVEV